MQHLPAELILAITGQVFDVKDRLSLLRVCRHWRAILLDVVYSALEINTPQICNLVHALLVYPHLSTSILNVTVLGWHEPSGCAGQESLNADVQGLLDEIAESPKEINDWREELLREEQGSWLALLLVLAPNLISISWDYTRPSPWVTVVVSRAALKGPPFDTRPALRYLQSVEIRDMEYDEPSEYTSFYQVMPFFHLPSMRSMSLENVKDFGPFEADLSLLHCDQGATRAASGTSTIEILILPARCNLSSGAMDFIMSCANLRKFVYQHDNEIDEHIHRDFRPQQFHNALLSQKHSLEVLHLNDMGDVSCGLDETWEDDAEPADRWFGSFAEFAKLWDLRVRVRNLFNLHPKDRHHDIVLKEVLPGSLKWLHLTDCDEEHCSVLVGGILDLLGDRQELFLDLEQIFVYSGVAESSQPQPAGPHRPPQDVRVLATISQQFEPVQTLCDHAGITFKLLLGARYRIFYRG
ncbi:hypothetical protein BJX63DRAFT_396013 [Aspergillus granulosus]|uniref:F-box domain-containing protein n=1 Tax=Aspergillus granulosus TaxID=176169 RepID=A0ABR4HBB2_9EURO